MVRKGPSLDEPFVASRQLTQDYIASAPYVQQCLKPLGIVDIMHLFLVYTPLHFGFEKAAVGFELLGVAIYDANVIVRLMTSTPATFRTLWWRSF
jgi:hypothetical protein